MKSISKWLVPGFLRRLDQYLRERYPVVWYSGAHWVLFYGLLGGMVLFGAGLLSPVHWVTKRWMVKKYINLDQWVVDPITPIEFAYDDFYIYPLLLVLTFACIWMYRQFQIRQFFYQVQHSLFCILIYVGCWWVLGGITAAAFRMGTIVKTAWIWMPERDLQDFKQSGIYPHGFVPLEEDKTGFIPADTLFFFRKHEKEFKRIWGNEETWLKPRYKIDKRYWKKRLAELGMKNLSYLPDRSFLSDRSGLSFLSYLSDRSDLSFRSNLSNLSDRSFRSYLSDLSDRLYGSDRSYWWYLSYRSDRWYLSDLSDLLGRSDQYILFYEAAQNRIKHPKASAYNLINYNDTLKTDPLVIIPSLPNQIEDAVRSIEHARQFLREGIFWRYFFHLFHYLFFLSVLLFLVPWLSARNFLQLLIFAFLFFCILGVLGFLENEIVASFAIFSVLPTTGILLLISMLWQQKQGQLLRLAINMVFLGLFFILLMCSLKNVVGFLPTDITFYGAQLIGLLAACIVPYVQAMPKTR